MGTEKTNDLPLTESEEVNELQVHIDAELKKFNVADKFIADLKEKYAGVEVSSLEDKENIALMKEGLKLARDSRIAVEKKRKSLKEESLMVGRAIDGEAKRITEGLLETETPLKSQKEKIEKWENEEKERKAAEEQKLIDDRVEALKNAGIEFDGRFYSIGNTISVDISTIKELSDVDFQFLVAKVGAEAERIRVEKEAEEARKKEEEERQRKEREALDLKAKELAKKEEEMAERLKKIEAAEAAAKKAEQDERRRKEEEAEKKIIEVRSKEIQSVGFTFDYSLQQFIFKNVAGKKVIDLIQVKSMDDEMWEKLKTIVAGEVASLISKAEDIVKEEKEKERQQIIKEQEEKAAAEQAEKERKQQEEEAEQKRLDALRPDAEKVLAFLNKVKAIEAPVVEDEELKNYMGEFQAVINETINDLQSRLAN